MPPPPGSEKGLAKVGFLEGLAKPVALWSPGPWSRGLWSSGPAVLWSPGPLVPRSSGPVVLRSRMRNNTGSEP